MTNFVYDNVALPATKSDKNPVTDPTHQWAASDAAATFTALQDIRTILQGVTFNVKAFGAVGDGTTDDQLAIRAAITAAATTVSGGFGTYVLFPKGTYITSQKLQLPNGVGLLAQVPSTATIRAASTFHDTALVENLTQNGTQEFAFLNGILFDGNQAGGATCTTAVVNLVSLFINSYFRDIVVINGSNVGLRIAAAGSPGGMGPVLVDNVWVTNCLGHNVLIEEFAGNSGACDGIVCLNLTSEHQGSGKSAIYLKGLGSAAGWSFVNTHIEMGQGGASAQTGITIDGVPDVLLEGVQLLTGSAAAITAGIAITTAIQNVRIQIRSVTNANLIGSVLVDSKNSVTVGAVNMPWYATPELNFRGAPRFTPDTATGAKSVAFQNSGGLDRAWFDNNGQLTGASLNGAALDLVGDTTNNRPLMFVPSLASGLSNLYGWLFPTGGGGVLRFRSFTGGADIFQIGTDGTLFFYQAPTFQSAVTLQSTLAITGNIGFYGHAVAAKPTITGSRAGNAALASLLTGLAGLGLITDSTTA